MRVLVLGLYAEGSTDVRFLNHIIRRATEGILAQYDGGDSWDEVYVQPLNLSSKQHKNQAQNILAAAESACGFHLLIIHADADEPSHDRALEERFNPGLALVKQAGKNVCLDLLPIIPIQEIEAWLLADREVLLKELGITNSQTRLNIPSPRLIEAMARPKEHLEDIIRDVNRSRRRPISREELYEPLGQTVRLEKLCGLSAYRQFISDLTGALVRISI